MKCFFCGSEHEFKCPLITAYEYGPDNKIERIEFAAPEPTEPVYYHPTISVQDWWLLNLPTSPTRH